VARGETEQGVQELEEGRETPQGQLLGTQKAQP
jgi:hypothetical protein